MTDAPRTEGALAIAPSAPPPTTPAISRLTCRAPHPDPKKKGKDCGGLLGDVPGKYEFVTTAKKAPADPDGYVWLRCPGGRCGTWNKFRILPPEPQQSSSTAIEVRTIEARFGRLPENQQQAVLALAGGLSVGQTARAVGVDPRTIHRWAKDEEFAALRTSLAPEISKSHIQTALAGFFDVVEKDRKEGVATNMRWFLSRTVFADFERSRAAARGSSVNVGVSMTQSQEQTESSIKREWEVRTRGISAPVASER